MLSFTPSPLSLLGTRFAQIPTSRNLDNPCTLRAKIRDARRLQDAAVECRGYRAVVEAVSHKLRHAATRRSDEARPFGVLRAVADVLAERVSMHIATEPLRRSSCPTIPSWQWRNSSFVAHLPGQQP